jgi:hypothetical protein
MRAVAGLRVGTFLLLVLSGLSGDAWIAHGQPSGEKIFAMVSKVEGKGTAKLRRAIGTESVVGSQMEVYPGDRIVTDDDSTVDLALADGTIIRVGINSEFHLQEAQLKRKFISWVFGLMQGSIRSLAEKSADHQSVKIRVNSPSGTMGIRGTEVILGYDKASGQTSLYTIEGDASFGAVGCDQHKSCVEVTTGTFSRVSEKSPKPATPARFQDKDLFGIPGATEAAKDNSFRQRLVLLQGVGHANSALAAVMSESDVKKAIDTARNSLQAQQDAMLFRTAQIRRAMYAAMAAGTYDQVLKIADNYETSRGRDAEVKDFSVINSGPIAAKKFALGMSIIESPVFKDDDGDNTSAKGGGDDFKVLSKDSDSLKKAAAWSETAAKDPSSAPFVSIDGNGSPGGKTGAGKAPAAGAPPEGKELRALTGTEKALLKDFTVQNNHNELAATTQGVATNKNNDCNALCALQKSVANMWSQMTAAPLSTLSKKKGWGANACARYVTVCTYKKIGHRHQKVCNQVCKSGGGDDDGSAPAN